MDGSSCSSSPGGASALCTSVCFLGPHQVHASNGVTIDAAVFAHLQSIPILEFSGESRLASLGGAAEFRTRERSLLSQAAQSVVK